MLRCWGIGGKQRHLPQGRQLLRTSTSSPPSVPLALGLITAFRDRALQIDNVFVPAVGDRDSDDLRQNASSPNPFPPEFYVTFLRNATIMEKIGAEARYSECPDAPFELFERTGDVRIFIRLG